MYKFKNYSLKNIPIYAWGLFIISLIKQSENYSIVIITNENFIINKIKKAIIFLNINELLIIYFIEFNSFPYHSASQNRNIVLSRISTLYKLKNNKKILLLTIKNLMQRIPIKENINKYLKLKLGQHITPKNLKLYINNMGYRKVKSIIEYGEYISLNESINIYPLGNKFPLHINLFNNKIKFLYFFNPIYINIKKKNKIILLPMHEYNLKNHSIYIFKKNFKNIHKSVKKTMYIEKEQYIQIFFNKTSTFFDNINDKLNIILFPNIYSYSKMYCKLFNEIYKNLNINTILPPDNIFTTVPEIFNIINLYNPIQIKKNIFNFDKIPIILIDNYKKLNIIKKFIDKQKSLGNRILFIYNTFFFKILLDKTLKKIKLILENVDNFKHFIKNNIYYGSTIDDSIDNGVIINDIKLVIITYKEIIFENMFNNIFSQKFNNIKPCIPIFHNNHVVDRSVGDFINFEYAKKNNLYVNFKYRDISSRYLESQHNILDKTKVKNYHKKEKKIKNLAIKILDIYSIRKIHKGVYYKNHNNVEYIKFLNQLLFEETPDQINAINEVFSDMIQKHPMDRLLCGDVGAGKTEVAMRAAFIAINSEKQVAVLVPSTLLALQHYDTLCKRFSCTSINIELITRFKKKYIIQKINNIKSGKYNIIIGTHKLLNNNIKFYNLGLIIIDEEHRFGVLHKEKLKIMRIGIDVLSMSATPIPRTLSMINIGIYNISIISKPPPGRIKIKIFIKTYSEFLIIEIINREINRGGQLYYIYNKVHSIQQQANIIRKIVPEARIGIVHGKLNKCNIEKVMNAFINREINILICSTIIEMGINIQNANTIIIDRADKLGLAQLHQIIGRIGRSKQQAYAYLLIPKYSINNYAINRLKTILNSNYLNDGLTIANFDLELRGGGQIFGEEQSGKIIKLGYDLYMEILNKAIKNISTGKSLVNKINIGVFILGFIPESYIYKKYTRLIFYKRIINASNYDNLHKIKMELIEKFGLLPTQVIYLFRLANIKLQAWRLGIKILKATSKNVKIVFSKKNNVYKKILNKEKNIFKIDDYQLFLNINIDQTDKSIYNIESILNKIEN
ncbi:Transcription-repair coupling factor [Candidatus Johnevansia muelleri]|uniref:Transcription-repair coupling factor n=1 Tax=Candidatus Johnevansia muelleri TaxID=1495769 RepID=A0A078KHZ0_9GAMM|nr:Transcription-repair coupling factor [Candidatus Evansia muelleri]